MKHWSRFPAFTKGLRSTLTKPNLNFKVGARPAVYDLNQDEEANA